MKLPKTERPFLAKASSIRNTGQAIDQMTRVISSVDAYMESGLRSVPHLKTVIQLLSNMESCQLNSVSQAHRAPEESELTNDDSELPC